MKIGSTINLQIIVIVTFHRVLAGYVALYVVCKLATMADCG